jgi:heavy metal translocating P-type ATPase
MSDPSGSGPENIHTLKSKPVTCDLCGLNLVSGIRTLTRKGQEYRFCCIGCKQVFRMLADATENPDISSFKDTEIFRQCQALGIIPRTDPETESEKKQADFQKNQPEITEAAENEHLLQLRLLVEGMWCPACAWVIENALLKHKGVFKVSCNFSTDRVTLSYDPVKTSPHQIFRAINSLGYTLSISGETSESKQQKKEFIRFGVSAFLTMNVMMLSFSLYSGFFTELSRDSIRYISWPILLMATVVLVYGGRKIHQKGWAPWRSLGFGMETLISAGSLCTYFFSLYHFLLNSLHLYFDTSSMLITLVLLGKILESRAKESVTKDLESFFSLVPTKVRISTPAFPDGKYVSARQLMEGDCFVLEENEIVPADGLVIDGRGAMDESTLTGEAIPKNKTAGDRIKSGTRVISGKLIVKAEVMGENSILGQMILIMEKALGQKTPLEGKTDIVLRWFVPGIILLAAGTGLFGFLFGLSPEQALVRAVTVMVISCPCALGIAIPLARVAGISLAARQGILVRDFSAFESAPYIDTFVFDKTGTLTNGDWHLLGVNTVVPWTENEIIGLAAGLEKKSEHHIGMIIRQYARQKMIIPADVGNILCHENGVYGIYENKQVQIGSESFCFLTRGKIATGLSNLSLFSGKTVEDSDRYFPISREMADNVDFYSLSQRERAGVRELKSQKSDDQAISSSVYLTMDGRIIGRIIFGDRIKKGAIETIQKLHKRDYQSFLVSGDSENATEKVARDLGIQNALGEMTPLQKADFISSLKKEGKIVAMAGDGINDAPALTGSDLAMAVHSGSLLGKEAAHLTLMRGEPLQVIDFLNLARRVNGKINQNLVFSFLYNFIAIPAAMAGLLSPLVAVCAMLLSSLSVTGNTLLLMKKHR